VTAQEMHMNATNGSNGTNGHTEITPKRRGRPPKNAVSMDVDAVMANVNERLGIPAPKRRGRPPKAEAMAVYEELRKPLARGEAVDASEVVNIPQMNLQVVQIQLVGVTPLIVHKFSEKSRIQMEKKQQGVAQERKGNKDPQVEYEGCFYLLGGKGRRYGFPGSGFKKAAVSACRFVEGISMSAAKGSFHILDDLVEIVSDPPFMRTDTVRVGGFGKKVADIRYRPEFQNWSVTLTIRYNASAINRAQLAHLLNTAGFAIGVGEWRPEKDGSFGQFQVAEGPQGRRKRS
jgi:hypothetical protein